MNDHNDHITPNETADRPEQDQKGYGARTARGIVWNGLAIVIGKGASFFAQLALGWILAKDDFAVYAMAISISGIVMAMRNGGIQRILIQRGPEYDNLAGPLFQIALVFNLIAAGLILACIGPVVAYFETPELASMLMVVAVSIPLGTAAVVLLARLSIELRFAAVARISALSSTLRHGSSVGFALAGFGPLSFVLPLLVVACYETVACWRVTGWWPRGKTLDRTSLAEILKTSSWIIGGALGITLIQQGDYLVLGKLQEKAVLAAYFFGFQLIGSINVLFTSAMSSVLTPTFVRLGHDRERQAASYVKACGLLTYVAVPAYVGAVILMGPCIHWLWAGKWDDAIFVAQVMGIVAPFRLLGVLGTSLIEALGRWGTWAVLLAGSATSLLVFVGMAAWYGGLYEVALAAGLFQILRVVVVTITASILSHSSVGKVIITCVLSLFVTGLAWGISKVVVDVVYVVDSEMVRASVQLMIYIVTVVPFLRYGMPNKWAQIMNVLSVIRRKKGA